MGLNALRGAKITFLSSKRYDKHPVFVTRTSICQSYHAYLTTVGKSSAEKINKESKEVVMNILPREPSVTRPAM